MPLRVLLVDDHEPVRRGIRSLLTRHPDWSVCGEAADGLEATQLARELQPDVILMDMSMPRMGGAEATRIIRKEVPQAHVIIVTQSDPALVQEQASQIGARGYVSKSTLARDLLPAIVKIIGMPSEGEAPESREEVTSSRAAWLFGGGDLGHLMRHHNWSGTPLGPIGNWPQSLRAAVNVMLNSQHPMWIGWGPEVTFLYNDAYISVLSLAKHPGSLGRPAREVWAEIWDVCGPLVDKVFARAEPTFMNDVRLFMSRGEYLEETYYSFSYSPVFDDDGKVGGLFCPSTEVTAKVLHARRLRTLSELSAKALVEKSIQAACQSCVETLAENPEDVPFSLLYVLDSSRQVATLAGTSHVPLGVEGVSPSEISLADQQSTTTRWPIQTVVETSQARVVPLSGVAALPLGAASQAVTEAMVLPITPPGRVGPAAVLIAGVNPTRKLDRDYTTFFSLIADQAASAIQNATVAEEEKKRADALAEIDRAKTQFFSNVSHEFRTPLTLMLGPLESMLAQAATLPPEHRDHLEVAHRNSLRLLKLVNTLLDFSRIEAGRVQPAFEPTDLASLTTDLASLFRSTIEQAGLEFAVNCESLDEPAYVDPEMWEKIVFNLLSNAFKFTFAGGIVVELRRANNSAEFTVRDSGTGIPAEELPHVFERFHRVKNAQGRTIEGSGIGLALVQELAKIHGGTAQVESELGRGTKFTIRIPLGKEHLPPDRIGAPGRVSVRLRGEAFLIKEAGLWRTEPVATPVRSGASTAKAHPIPVANQARILIADDNADMREYLGGLLAGYQVDLAPDGDAALQAALKNPPDLVLTDVMMPSLDGFGLLHKLRANETTATIPVILLSARAGDESRLEGVAAGADDYLTKPFSARELTARVETHLKLSRLRREGEERYRQLAETLEAQVRARTRELEERNAEVLSQSQQLRELSWELLHTEDEERRRIARELHDSSGQILTMLGINLAGLVEQASKTAPGLAPSLEKTEDLVQQLTKEIRTTSYLLHPPLLDESGLPAALSWYIRGLAERSGLDISFNISEGFVRLPREMELVVFRLVQECLTNVHRHSGSRSARVRLVRRGDEVSIEVQDRGKGISPERLAEIQSKSTGVGIRGMRERLRQFGGELVIKSSGAGTTVFVTVPVPKQLQ